MDEEIEEPWEDGEPRGRASSAAEVIRGLFGSASGLSDTQRAALVWNEVNGDIERRHTCGVYLRAARRRDEAPVLGVYLDSHSQVVDMGANEELYLGRLANGGLQVSGIEFKVSSDAFRPVARAVEGERQAAREAPTDVVDLPPLGRRESRRVDEMVSGLPEPLRQSASRAVELSMRRMSWLDSGT